MSPVALRALACLVALVAVEAIYLPDAPSSEEQAQAAPSIKEQAQAAPGVPDDYRTLEEDVIHGILDSYDPYVIKKLPFNQTLKEITVSGLITNLTITGLSGLKANKLSLQGAKVAANVTLPSIAAVGQYNMTGVLPVPGLATLPLDGSGQITFGLSNLELDVAIELGISDKGQITLDECELTWNMTTIKFRMDGVLGGSALGNMINNILKDALPHLVLKAYHDKITTYATSAAADFLPTIHQDHGPLPPFEAPAPPREQRTSRVRRAAARAEDIRELLKDGLAEAEAQDGEDSDGPVLLSHLLTALARGGGGDGAEDGERLHLAQLPSSPVDADDDDDGSLLGQVLSALGLRADQLDLRQLVSFERHGETRFLEHGELSGELSGKLSGEQDPEDDGLLESLAHGLGLRLTGTQLHPHGALA